LGSCLFESVEGGETRGRYSIVACDPDLMHRVDQNGAAFAMIDETGVVGPFTSYNLDPLASLRKLLADSALEFPPDLPPPAAGIFGYLAYETVGHVERLPANLPDPIGVPESILVRPRLVIASGYPCPTRVRHVGPKRLRDGS
jgi:anthranilate synthase component I